MNKDEVFELIKEGSKELFNSNVIMYSVGSLRKEEAKKIGKTCEHIFIDDKPEFVDMQGYRESLLKLISTLIDFYQEM